MTIAPMRFLLFIALACSLHASTSHYIGSGSAMSPGLFNGEILDVSPLPFGQLEPGRLVAFRVDNDGITETLAHRLIERNADGSWVTKADGNHEVDPWMLTPVQYVGAVYRVGRIDREHARVLGQRVSKLYVVDIRADENRGWVPFWRSSHAVTPVYLVPDSGSTLSLFACSLALAALFVRRAQD